MRQGCSGSKATVWTAAAVWFLSSRAAQVAWQALTAGGQVVCQRRNGQRAACRQSSAGHKQKGVSVIAAVLLEGDKHCSHARS